MLIRIKSKGINSACNNLGMEFISPLHISSLLYFDWSTQLSQFISVNISVVGCITYSTPDHFFLSTLNKLSRCYKSKLHHNDSIHYNSK